MWQWWIGLPWNVWLDQTQKLSQILAIVIGGVWAYTKFFRGRVFYTRLEPSVTGQIVRREEADYVIIVAKLKNVGISKIDLKQPGTGVRVFGYSTLGVVPRTVVKWDRLNTVDILSQHAWIEANEIIDGTVMIALPRNLFAVKLEMRIAAHRKSWHAEHIVTLSDTKTKGELQ